MTPFLNAAEVTSEGAKYSVGSVFIAPRVQRQVAPRHYVRGIDTGSPHYGLASFKSYQHCQAAQGMVSI